jgi:hypothetical protein
MGRGARAPARLAAARTFLVHRACAGGYPARNDLQPRPLLLAVAIGAHEHRRGDAVQPAHAKLGAEPL